MKTSHQSKQKNGYIPHASTLAFCGMLFVALSILSRYLLNQIFLQEVSNNLSYRMGLDGYVIFVLLAALGVGFILKGLLRRTAVASRPLNIFSAALISTSLLFYLALNVSQTISAAVESGRVQQIVFNCLSGQLIGCEETQNSAALMDLNYAEILQKLDHQTEQCLSDGQCKNFCIIAQKIRELDVGGFENWNIRFNPDLNPPLKQKCFTSASSENP